MKSNNGGKAVSQLSRFDGTLDGVLSLRGNVKINSGRNIDQDCTVVKYRVINLEDKAHLMGEDYNTSCF
ncbi:hypothetical protein Tco_0297043, partial [Tanacetum coccineum]